MIKQIKLLTKIQLCNLFSINEFRYTKDKKRKFQIALFGAIWFLVLGYIAAYAGGISFGLCSLQVGQFVPAVLSMSVAMVVFLFTTFKAGAVIFSKKSYDLQMPLPVSTTTVVISRFLTMYVTNLGLTLFVMIPGFLVYGCMEKTGIFFYLYGIIGILFLPLLPLTAATIIGAGMVAIASRYKRKNLVEIILTFAFVLVLFLGSFSMTGMEEGDINEMLYNMAEMLETKISSTYPPALWLSNAMILENHLQMLLFVGSSILLFVVLILVLQKNYVKICSILHAHGAGKAYEMDALQSKSILRSLWERELRHYFSSSIYVTNTMIGYLMMVVVALALLVMGTEKVETAIGVTGVVSRVLPIVLGMVAALMPTTASSISIEGKEWWIAQTLPISMKQLITSKILMNITVVMPFYFVSEILACIAVKPKGTELLWLVLIPALYIILGAVSGMVINLKLPVFNWESEVYVVKQSAAVFVSMLTGMICGVVPMAIMILCQNLSADLLYVAIALVMVGLIVCSYMMIRTNMKK